MMPNKEAAAKTVKAIEAHREMLNMNSWAVGLEYLGAEWPWKEPGAAEYRMDGEEIANAHCGTTLCAAGFGSLATGHTIKYDVGHGLSAYDAEGNVMAPYGSGERTYTDWNRHGADVFGITDEEAGRLFVADEEAALDALKAMAAGDDDWFDNVVVDGWI